MANKGPTPCNIREISLPGTEEIANEYKGSEEVLASNAGESSEDLCFDMNGSSGSLEATRAQLTDFDLPLSGLTENVGRVCEEKHSELREVRSEENIKKRNDSGFQLYQEGRDEADDSYLLLLDLNVKGSRGEMVGGSRGNDLDLRIQTQGL